MSGFTIPSYQNNIAQEPVSAPGTPSLGAPTPTAFGTGVAEATEKLGSTVSSTGELLANHIIERQRQAQLAQVIQADSGFKTDLQKSMYDTTPDQNGVPKGVFNRQGLAANGATESFDADFMAKRQATMDTMDTPYKKQRLGELMDENYPRYRELVAKHEGAQVRLGQLGIVLGHNDLAMQSAPQFVGDPQGLIKSIETESQLLHNGLADNGTAPDMIAKKVNDLAGKIVSSSIRDAVLQDPKTAQDFFDKITGDPKNPLSLSDQDLIQKQINNAQQRFTSHQKTLIDTQFNAKEAGLSGKEANGDLTQMELDSVKDEVSPSYYHIASVALQNKPGTVGTPANQSNNFVSLMQKYATVNGIGDPDKKTAAMMKLREDVMAEKAKLPADGYKHLLSWTDPDFVEKKVSPNAPWYKAGIDFVKDHVNKFTDGKGVEGAIADFVNGAAQTAKPSDIPAVAQQVAKAAAIKANPSLMGQPDVSNNIVNQKTGIQQVYGQQTNLKPDQKVTASMKPPFGNETTRNGKTYIWSSADNKYHPKAGK